MTGATPSVPMTRDQFDAALRARITGMVADAEAAPTQEARREARAAAQDAERRARAFADAVDAGGASHLGYQNAVLITGSHGQQVCDLRSYDETPFYWQALAAGASGSVEVIAGVDLITELGSNAP